MWIDNRIYLSTQSLFALLLNNFAELCKSIVASYYPLKLSNFLIVISKLLRDALVVCRWNKQL